MSNHSGRSRLNPLLVAFIALSVAGGLWVLFSGLSSSPASQQDTTSSKASPATSVTTHTDAQTPTTSATTTTGCEASTDLETRTRCFIVAWYALKPTDSTESKQARVQPYASELFMSQHAGEMEVMTDTEVDMRRIQSQDVYSAEVTGEVQITQDQPSPGLTQVISVATLIKESPEMEPLAYLTVYTNTVWRQVDGQWYIESVRDVAQ